MIKRCIIGIFVILMAMGLCTTAQAATVNLTGTQGNVVVGEYEGLGLPFEGGYFVDVLNLTTEVFGVAVSTNDVDPSGVGTDRSGWFATAVTSTEWDDALIQIGLPASQIGTFVSLFGDDAGVNIYVNINESNPITDANDNDQPFGSANDIEFFFGGQLSSEFVAFDQTGTIIDQSLHAVPAPSAMLLMGTGLIGLIALCRRKGKLAA